MSSDDIRMTMGEALTKYVARESVQTYDYGIKYSGLGKNLQEIVENPTWDKLLADVGYKLSLFGTNQALVLEMIDGKPFIDAGDLTEYTKVGNKVTRAAVNAKEFSEINGKKEPIYSIFEDKDGEITKVKAYISNKNWVLQEETRISVPFNQIPVYKLQNNVLGMADIPEELSDMLRRMDWLSDEFVPEWIAASTQWVKNNAFDSQKTADDYLGDSLKHNKIHESHDPDNKVGPAIAPISGGTQSIINLSVIINFVEDKILKYSMQFREVGQGGSNKHNLEISSQNKQAFEYMLAKLDWRQKQLSAALTFLQGLINTVTDDEAGTIAVSIAIPELEEFKEENMKAQVDNLKAQTENQKAQAQSWEAQAKATEEGKEPVQPMGGE